MKKCYSKLLSEPVQHVAEKKQNYHFFTERHLQAIWFEQKYFKGIATDSGIPIEVLSPGIWNAEAGPDFKKAHLKIGSHEYFGDIEMHLMDHAWFDHQHHLDDRYNQVVLHISLWRSRKPSNVMTASGKILQVYLEDFMTIPIARLNHLIDLDLYPYKKFIGSGRCSHELFKTLPSNEIEAFFEKAADWRLSQKREYLKQRVENQALHIGAGIAMALGYKNNSEQFLELFLQLQNLPFKTEQNTFAWLLKKFGFFAPYFTEKWSKSPWYCQLKEISETFLIENPLKLHLHQIRPLNHPIRRLVVLAKMRHDDNIQHLHDRILHEWNNHWHTCMKKKKWKELLEALKQLLPNYTDTYWNQHYLFEEAQSPIILTLLGNDLKQTIIINTVLPLLEETIMCQGLHDEIEAFQSFYRSLPSAKAGKSKYLTHRFFGNSQKSKVLANAYTEQGAYQLHYDFCSHFEASCDGCPFVERYKSALIIL